MKPTTVTLTERELRVLIQALETVIREHAPAGRAGDEYARQAIAENTALRNKLRDA